MCRNYSYVSLVTVSPSAAKKRVIVYVDGFNVYYGFKRKGWRKFLWLDYRSVFESILKPDQLLVDVKYFTALSLDGESRGRQETYLNALRIRGGLTILLGKIVKRPHKCPECGHRSKRDQEKESDVNLTVQALLDAFDGRMDEVWIVSRYSDLVPLVRALREKFGLKVLIVKPPNGSGDTTGGDELVRASGEGAFWVQSRVWKRSQLPDELQERPGARRQRRPEKWS